MIVPRCGKFTICKRHTGAGHATAGTRYIRDEAKWTQNQPHLVGQYARPRCVYADEGKSNQENSCEMYVIKRRRAHCRIC